MISLANIIKSGAQASNAGTGQERAGHKYLRHGRAKGFADRKPSKSTLDKLLMP
jgi:hypothetical protein